MPGFTARPESAAGAKGATAARAIRCRLVMDTLCACGRPEVKAGDLVAPAQPWMTPTEIIPRKTSKAAAASNPYGVRNCCCHGRLLRDGSSSGTAARHATARLSDSTQRKFPAPYRWRL